jgi:hypothetical protein
MSRTCSEITHHIPHWVNQGIDYQNRRKGDIDFSHDSNVGLLKKAWLQPAAQTLEEMYGNINHSTNHVNISSDMQKRLEMLGVTTLREAAMEEEQEREVSHEVEQQVQLERPPKLPPAIHCLDTEVVHFVRSGIISRNFTAFLPLMSSFLSNSETLNPKNPWATQLLCTRDFATTTKEGNERTVITDYMRPVNWIVSHIRPDVGDMILVVMSPYEVNILLEDIRKSKFVRLHMYAPRTTQNMKSFDDLKFYCIPPLSLGSPSTLISLDMRCQLNIWAGQLYLDNYETYLRLCLLLGLSSSHDAGYSSVKYDRFVPEIGRNEEMRSVCLFKESPLSLITELFGLRRKGMSYDLTHMGRILRARILSREEFSSTT